MSRRKIARSALECGRLRPLFKRNVSQKKRPQAAALQSASRIFFPPPRSGTPNLSSSFQYVMQFILFLISPTITFAQETNAKEMREAEAYYESGEYPEADKIYEQLLGGLAPWQQDFLKYNIGTSLLAEGKDERAIAQYKTITLDKNASPLLIRRLKTNVAIAYYRMGGNLMKTLSSAPDLREEDYNKAIYLFQEALENIQLAEQADCTLDIIEGARECTMGKDLVEFKLATKQQLAKLFEKLWDYKLKNTTTKDGGPLLATDINNGIYQVDFLLHNTLSNDLRNFYIQHFLEEQNSWVALWNNIKEKIETDYKSNPKYEDLVKQFETAASEFMSFLTYLEKGQLEDALNTLNTSMKSLTEYMRLIWGLSGQQEVIQKLVNLYQTALSQEYLQPQSLLTLSNEQNQIIQIVQSVEKNEKNAAAMATISQTLNSSKDYLELSLEALRQSNQMASRLFLEGAAHRVNTILRLFEQTQNLPKSILEFAIDDQKNALSLYRLADQLRDHSFMKDKIHSLLTASQKDTLQTANPFLKAVLAQQILAFQSPKEESGMPRCQEKPWDEVLPLFDSGDVSAANALKQIDMKSYQISSAMPQQELALKYWQEALNKLNQSEKKSHEKENQEQKQQQPPSKPSVQQPSSTADVLRMLLQMNQMDHQPQPANRPVKQGEKPW